jgi:hypothetical protein
LLLLFLQAFDCILVLILASLVPCVKPLLGVHKFAMVDVSHNRVFDDPIDLGLHSFLRVDQLWQGLLNHLKLIPVQRRVLLDEVELVLVTWLLRFGLSNGHQAVQLSLLVQALFLKVLNPRSQSLASHPDGLLLDLFVAYLIRVDSVVAFSQICGSEV